MNTRLSLGSGSAALLLLTAAGSGCWVPDRASTDAETTLAPMTSGMTDGASADSSGDTDADPSATSAGPSSLTDPGAESTGMQGETDESTGMQGETAESTGSGNESSGGEVAVCGDGSVGDAEECDDANEIDADGCDADCTTTRVIQIGVGHLHTCALFDSGDLRCWGANGSGALGSGNGDTIGDDEPASAADFVDVGGGKVTQLAVGAAHTCALLEGGTMRCWGDASYGKLGYGDLESHGAADTPADVGDVDVGGSVVHIAAGYHHTCAVLESGMVRCWGAASTGQLGYGDVDQVGDDEAPADVGVVVIGGGDVTALAIGANHTCATLDSGSLRCWGSSGIGQLGYGNIDTIGDDEFPSSAGDVPVGASVSHVAAFGWHTCAALGTGGVRCWGHGEGGRLGYGSNVSYGDDEWPSDIGDIDLGGNAVAVTAGVSHSCALLDDGAVRCWGQNGAGLLGYGHGDAIGDDEAPSTAGDIDLGGVAVQIASSEWHNCAVLDTGAVRCWGAGGDGRLGYGSSEDIGDDETPAAAGDVPIF
jgi:cysteine-rich repeat protein